MYYSQFSDWNNVCNAADKKLHLETSPHFHVALSQKIGVTVLSLGWDGSTLSYVKCLASFHKKHYNTYKEEIGDA